MPEMAIFWRGVASMRQMMGKGKQRMEASVTREEMELPIHRASTLMHWPPGRERSQK